MRDGTDSSICMATIGLRGTCFAVMAWAHDGDTHFISALFLEDTFAYAEEWPNVLVVLLTAKTNSEFAIAKLQGFCTYLKCLSLLVERANGGLKM